MIPALNPFLLPCALFQVALYALARCALPTRKARAWALTLAVATLFGFVIGIPNAYALTAALLTGDPAKVAALLSTETPFGRFCATYMVTFLALDLAIGVIDYSEQLQLLSGYVHHVAYCALYSYLLYWGKTQFVLVGAICEVPTAIMALGTIAPALRQDAGFGVSFFFTRIVWFVVLLVVYCLPQYNKEVRIGAPGGGGARAALLGLRAGLVSLFCPRSHFRRPPFTPIAADVD